MNLGRFFQRLALYRAARGVPTWALIALALAFYALAAFDAKAQLSCPGYHYATESQSAACAGQWVNNYNAQNNPTYEAKLEIRATSTIHKSYTRDTRYGADWSLHANWTWNTSCPAGTQPNPDNNYACEDPGAACLAKPPLGSTKIEGAGATACQGGCAYAPTGDSIGVDFGDGAGFLYNSTGWAPTGATCTTDNVDPATHDSQTCKPAPNGQTFCIKPDGKQCATASTGRQLCWTPGQTGEQYDADVGQRRNPGTDTTPPTPPPGETAAPKFPPQTTTTNVNNTTVNTTLVTHSTTNGTDFGGPGGTNTGEPGDGTGSGSGDGDGSGITADSIRGEAETLDQGEGGEGVDGTTAWGADEGGEFTPDEGGFGLTRTCPAPPEVMGQVLDFTGLCTIMQYVGLLILAAAHMHALYIIAGD